MTEDEILKIQWMFQYNPREYNLEDIIKQRLTDDWKMYRHRDSVRTGQRIYFMRSGGDKAAITAIGRIASPVYERPEETDRFQRYWVDVVFDDIVIPPVTRDEMRRDDDDALNQYAPFVKGQLASAFPLPRGVAQRTEHLVRGRTRPIGPSAGALNQRVFISHSHDDDDFGHRLAQDLRRVLGTGDDAVWYDSSGGLKGGDQWWAEIRAQLEARPIFVVILSPPSMRSEWVGNEIDMAWRLLHSKQRTRIIPVLYKSCSQRLDLQIIQQVSFLEPRPYEDAFKELVATITMID